MPRFEMRMPQELHDRIEAARGDVPKAKFVVRALEKALGDSEYVGHPQRERHPASSRASSLGEAPEDGSRSDLPVRGGSVSLPPAPPRAKRPLPSWAKDLPTLGER